MFYYNYYLEFIYKNIKIHFVVYSIKLIVIINQVSNKKLK